MNELLFSEINRVFDAKPVDGKEDVLRGWLKLPPSIITRDGHPVCTAEYIFGDWPTFFYEKASQ